MSYGDSGNIIPLRLVQQRTIRTPGVLLLIIDASEGSVSEAMVVVEVPCTERVSEPSLASDVAHEAFMFIDMGLRDAIQEHNRRATHVGHVLLHQWDLELFTTFNIRKQTRCAAFKVPRPSSMSERAFFTLVKTNVDAAGFKVGMLTLTTYKS